MENNTLLVERIISTVENMKKAAELKIEVQRLSKELAAQKDIIEPMLVGVERAMSDVPSALEFILEKTDNEDDKDRIEQILTSFGGDVTAVCKCILDDDKELLVTDPEVFDENISLIKSLADKTSVSEYESHRKDVDR